MVGVQDVNEANTPSLRNRIYGACRGCRFGHKTRACTLDAKYHCFFVAVYTRFCSFAACASTTNVTCGTRWNGHLDELDRLFKISYPTGHPTRSAENARGLSLLLLVAICIYIYITICVCDLWAGFRLRCPVRGSRGEIHVLCTHERKSRMAGHTWTLWQRMDGGR
jgi:hypothetical protein